MFREFIARALVRYRDLTWEQCEALLEDEWLLHAPDVSWAWARFYVLEAWRNAKAQGEQRALVQ